MASSASAESMTCRTCGKPFRQQLNTPFCPHCGASVNEAHGTPEDPFVGMMVENRFLIRKRLGKGSMGSVYLADHVALERPVAIKFLLETHTHDAVVQERFRREALAASRLKHANTLNVIHFGQLDDQTPSIVMEYIEGRDLGAVIAKYFPLGSQRIVMLLSQVCRALDEAHAQGIVHRDLKPSNIMVINRRGEELVKVLDFGIAKIQDPGPGQTMTLTRDGLVCGTPAFMSPEQVAGGVLDARSDLFSLGVILYMMLCGQLPFRAETVADMASAILLDEPVPPSRVRLDVTVAPELEDVCMRLLEKEPAHRIASTRELREALEHALRRHLAKGGDAGRQLDRSVVVGEDDPDYGVTDLDLMGPTQLDQPRFDTEHISAENNVLQEAPTWSLDTSSSVEPVTSDDVSAAPVALTPTAPPRRSWLPAVIGAVIGGGVLLAVLLMVGREERLSPEEARGGTTEQNAAADASETTARPMDDGADVAERVAPTRVERPERVAPVAPQAMFHLIAKFAGVGASAGAAWPLVLEERERGRQALKRREKRKNALSDLEKAMLKQVQERLAKGEIGAAETSLKILKKRLTDRGVRRNAKVRRVEKKIRDARTNP